jgi:NTE family protein
VRAGRSQKGATEKRTALVLGGGGVLGASWMVGALCALEEVRGVNVSDMDIIVGTSAGSVIGALLAAGVTPQQLSAHQHGEPITLGPLAGYSWDYESATGGSRPSRPRLLGPGSLKLLGASLRQGLQMPSTAMLSAFLPLGTGSLDRVGHLIDAITPMDDWSPHRDLRVVAMDYDRGRRVVFGQPAAPPAPLAQAVMASCAIPGWFAPVTIDGRSYIDGGAWSATSVDVLVHEQVDEVFVIAPMVSFTMDTPDSLLTRLERQWRQRVTQRCLDEIDSVEAQGAQVHVLGPGREDLESMGGNIMESSRRLQVLQTSLQTSRRAWQGGGSDSLSSTG